MGNVLDEFIKNDKSILNELDRDKLNKMDCSTIEIIYNKNINFLKKAFENKYNINFDVKLLDVKKHNCNLCLCINHNNSYYNHLLFNYTDDLLFDRQFGKNVLYALVSKYDFDYDFSSEIYGSICNIYYCRDEIVNKLKNKKERGL